MMNTRPDEIIPLHFGGWWCWHGRELRCIKRRLVSWDGMRVMSTLGILVSSSKMKMLENQGDEVA